MLTISVLINGVSYQVKSFSDHQTLTEELQSGSFTILTDSRIDIKPYDQIQISGLNEYFLVDTYLCEILRNNASSYPIYRYTINYIEMTKYLQAIPLSNRSVTQPIASWGTKRTCKVIVNRLLNSIRSKFDIVVNTQLADLLDSKVCPEFSWNRPTLWEALKDIFAQFDMLPKLTISGTQYTLKSKSLGKTNQSLETSTPFTEVGITWSSSMNNYAKKLDIEVENANSNALNTVEKGIQVRAEDGVIADESAKIILEHSVYGIKQVILKRVTSGGLRYETLATVSYTENGVSHTINVGNIDITNHLCSSEVYSTLEASNQNTVSDGYYKRNFLYFDKNTIQGLNLIEKFLGILNGDTALKCIIKNTVYKKYHDAHPTATNWNINYPGIDSATLDQYSFDIDYQTMDNLKVEIENEQSNGMNNVTLIDNQSDAYIDANAFAKIKQDNINYMSNEIIQINCKYTPSQSSNIVDVGATFIDYGDTCIIFDRKITATSGNEFRVVYLGCKNYPKINRSMQLNQAKRYTQLASASSSFLRQESVLLGNYYLRTQSYSGDSIANLALDFNNSDTVDKKVYHTARATYKYETTEQDSSSYFYLHSFNNKVGKSIILTTRFYNNVSVGLQVTGGSLGGLKEKRVSYTDEYGEMDRLQVWLGTGKESVSIEENYYNYMYKYPERYLQSNPTSYLTLEDLDIYKDNREILGLSFQINYKDTDYFQINEGLINLNPILLNTHGTITLSVYKGDTLDSNASVSVNGNHFTVTGLTQNELDYNVRDNNGNRLFTFKKKTTASSYTIYLAKED